MRLKSLPVALIAAGLAVSGLQTNLAAQGYPERPVRLLIAFPAGGTIDTLGRILAQKLTEAWRRRRPRPTGIPCISARKRSP